MEDRLKPPASSFSCPEVTEKTNDQSRECESMVRAINERNQLTEVVERLSARYPSVQAATVAQVVHELHRRFDSARIREFVPLLVERHARFVLSELSVTADRIVLSRARDEHGESVPELREGLADVR